MALYFCGIYELYAEMGHEPVLFPEKNQAKKNRAKKISFCRIVYLDKHSVKFHVHLDQQDLTQTK